MASYTIIKNTSLIVDLPYDFSIQGWEVSNGIAYHSGCNPGYIKNNFNLSSATSWTFRYKIRTLDSGTVNIVVGGVNGTIRTEAGTYEDTFNVGSPNSIVQFYATGTSSLELLQVFPEFDFTEGTTLWFNEDADKWVTYHSAVPEFMSKFLNNFLVFKNGHLWKNNTNPIRNNFFGVQYTSKITFYVNLSPTEVKNYFSMRQKSNSVWTAENNGDIYIYPTEGKPDGQSSRLKKGRFKRLQGDWFADFLRDVNDPRFLTEDEALFKGAQLQGNVMKITIENNSTQEVRLLSVDITVSKQNYTY